jgi:hypothetical protein
MSAEQNKFTIDLDLFSLGLGIYDARKFVVLSSVLAFSKELSYALTVSILSFVLLSMHKATSLAFTFFLPVIPHSALRG